MILMADKKEAKPKKEKYVIKVECLAPVTYEVEVWAEDHNQAKYFFERVPHLCHLRTPPVPNLSRIRNPKLSILNLISGIRRGFGG